MSRDATAEITIDGRKWTYWSTLRLDRFADSISTIEMVATFDPENPEFRDLFRPFSYRRITVAIGGALVFVGTMMGVSPSVTAEESTVTVSAYARCGVLNDCTPAPANFPLMYKGLTVSTIARRLIAPFGITLFMDAPDGDPFKEVALRPGQAILPFLVELVKQRGILITSDFDGELVMRQAATLPADSVARLDAAKQPVTAVSPNFNVQAFYSEITGIAPAKAGKAGGRWTVKNPLWRFDRADSDRPWTTELRDTEPGGGITATEAAMSQMYASAVSYQVDVATIFDQNDQLFEPNTFVTLTAPGAMIYGPYEFLIRSASLQITPTECTASLGLVLPGALTGTLPEILPWEE